MQFFRQWHQHSDLADFTGDAAADFLAADASGLLLYAGDSQGRFLEAGRRIRFAEAALLNPFVMTAGDIDRDGDLDVWLAQYKLPYVEGQMPTPYFDANDGFPSFLLLNDGRGHFQDHTEKAGLATKRFRRTYSNSFIDLDGDGDLDLFVVSDFAGVDIYFNDGRGALRKSPDKLSMNPTCSGWRIRSELRSGRDAGLFVIGMVIGRSAFGRLGLARRILEHQPMRPKMSYGTASILGGRSVLPALRLAIGLKSGWSWGPSLDFDNDNVSRPRRQRPQEPPHQRLQPILAASLLASSQHVGRRTTISNRSAQLYGAGYS